MDFIDVMRVVTAVIAVVLAIASIILAVMGY